MLLTASPFALQGALQALTGNLAALQSVAHAGQGEEPGASLSLTAFVQESGEFALFLADTDPLLKDKIKEGDTVAKAAEELKKVIAQRGSELPFLARLVRDWVPAIPSLAGGLAGALSQPEWNSDLGIVSTAGGLLFAALGSTAVSLAPALLAKHLDPELPFMKEFKKTAWKNLWFALALGAGVPWVRESGGGWFVTSATALLYWTGARVFANKFFNRLLQRRQERLEPLARDGQAAAVDFQTLGAFFLYRSDQMEILLEKWLPNSLGQRKATIESAIAISKKREAILVEGLKRLEQSQFSEELKRQKRGEAGRALEQLRKAIETNRETLKAIQGVLDNLPKLKQRIGTILGQTRSLEEFLETLEAVNGGADVVEESQASHEALRAEMQGALLEIQRLLAEMQLQLEAKEEVELLVSGTAGGK